jgi:hypothetical protein
VAVALPKFAMKTLWGFLLVIALTHAWALIKPFNPSYKLDARIQRNSMCLYSSKPDFPTWKIDIDSSEIECESSSELQRKIVAEKLRKELEEQQRQAEAKKLRKERDERQKVDVMRISSSINISTPIAPKEVVSTVLSVGNKGVLFDVGLFVLFPIMILTLGLFFVFPLVAPQLAKTLPPPMSY